MTKEVSKTRKMVKQHQYLWFPQGPRVCVTSFLCTRNEYSTALDLEVEEGVKDEFLP
jgi:hypothetical protein